MTKKQKKKSTLSPATTTLIVIILLILSAFGIQLPEVVHDYFGTTLPAPSQKAPVPTKETNPGAINQGLATFNQQELQDSARGWIRYHKLDALERPTGADALIKPAMIGTGTKAKASIRPPGFISGLEPYEHARGHLIGRQFGGSGDNPKNLVTLYQNPVNTPLMTEYENMVRQAVDHGETVRYRVTPIYNQSDLMPIEIHLEGQSTKKNGTINFNVSILNKK